MVPDAETLVLLAGSRAPRPCWWWRRDWASESAALEAAVAVAVEVAGADAGVALRGVLHDFECRMLCLAHPAVAAAVAESSFERPRPREG